MKNVFSIFGFATLLMFSFAFTPVTETADTCEEVCEVSETMTVSTADLFGSGKFQGCVAALNANVNVVYRLNHQGGAASIQMDADCMPDFLTLAFGEWDLYAVAFNGQAHASFEWEFCGTPGSAVEFLDVPGTAEYITQIFISC